MQNSYTLNYLKIYTWQGLTIILNFLAMLIVTPRLSELPVIYGIYSFCIATSVFFTYADLGFLGAGYKYVSESFARKNLNEEIQIEGFVSFILFVFVTLYIFIIIFIALNPKMLIKNLNDLEQIKIASRLLLILALSSPIVIFQRFLQTVCGIRLEDFIYQQVSMISSVIRIFSIFYFITPYKYDIVGYFLFSQLLNFLANFASLFIVKIRYHYNFSLFLKSFKFSKETFNRTKKLAFSSFFNTIIWVLFLELDLLVIAKLFGSREVAFYAVGLTLWSVFRGIYGMLYGPFSARFNHFVGLNAVEEFKDFYRHVIVITMPLVVFPIVSLSILIKPFIYSWVGPLYSTSVTIARLLILSFIYSFISYPASALIMAKVKIRLLYIISSLLLLIFWGGIISTASSLGLVSFAIFKFLAFTISGIIYIFISFSFLKERLSNFLKEIFSPIIIPCIFLITSLLYLNKFMPLEKNKLNLLIVTSTGGGISLLAICLYYLFSKQFKSYINQLFKKAVILYVNT